MLFNSFEFLIFFVVVTTLYFVLPFKWRWAMLLAASCMFYMFFIPVYILILLTTIVIDYLAGIYIEKSEGKKRRYILVVSLVSNIGILAFFKYCNFFIDNINVLFQVLHWNYSLNLLKIILPIGLSFHTFQAMSYTIEVYRGNQKAERHFGIYALYVMYYPQLVAGPIERPQNLLHQFHAPHSFNPALVSSGLKQMLIGFFKKMVIADNLATYVNMTYAKPEDFEPITIFLATIFFTLQVYCDFSGYSDIALGASRIMGIELMQNFKAPFLSKNVTEFWRRWHISLSTWFNDYLFMPLITRWRMMGNYGVYLALIITFFLSGFWHGAGWTFIIYGLTHGLAMVFELATKKSRKRILAAVPDFIASSFGIVITFVFVSFSFIFFRSESIAKANEIIDAFFKAIPSYIYDIAHKKYSWREPITFNKHMPTIDLLILLFSLSILFYMNRTEYKSSFINHLDTKPGYARWGFYQLLVICILVFGVFHSKQEFIYFQF